MPWSRRCLRDALPPVDLISAWGERIVGVALIGIGAWALSRSARIGTAPHAHGVMSHDHLHVKAGPAWVRRLGHAHASFYMGILHGVAGSSHFFGALPALALPTQQATLIYIGAFGAGTVVAMTAFAAAVGFGRVAGPRRHPCAPGDDDERRGAGAGRRRLVADCRCVNARRT